MLRPWITISKFQMEKKTPPETKNSVYNSEKRRTNKWKNYELNNNQKRR